MTVFELYSEKNVSDRLCIELRMSQIFSVRLPPWQNAKRKKTASSSNNEEKSIIVCTPKINLDKEINVDKESAREHPMKNKMQTLGRRWVDPR